MSATVANLKRGNPAGRRPGMAEIRDMYRENAPAALQCLVDIIQDDEAPHVAKVQAVREINDRGYGKPEMSMQVNHTHDGMAVVDAGKLAALLEVLQSLPAANKEQAAPVIDVTPNTVDGKDSGGTGDERAVKPSALPDEHSK